MAQGPIHHATTFLTRTFLRFHKLTVSMCPATDKGRYLSIHKSSYATILEALKMSRLDLQHENFLPEATK
ncbi:hypothetical protein ISS312_02386 [Alteromonas mediterranea]|nr:hypothetical protein ISS312_02386 [Alteromonas mediterranea]